MHSTLVHPQVAFAPPATQPGRRAVVVQSGARDAYQVALALQQADLLDTLVTDLYWPGDRGWAKQFSWYMPRPVQTWLSRRTAPELSSRHVRTCAAHGFATLFTDKLPGAPLALRKRITRRTDAHLGRTAGRIAGKHQSALLSYSYYGHAAFQNFQGCRVLFQLHPHPVSMRRILLEELERHPDCAASLRQEWELALSDQEFQRLSSEAALVNHFIAASSFTRSTLVENGVPADAVRVVPYGVDCAQFVANQRLRPSPNDPLRLLFVGRINQRKGIKDLLEAIQLVGTQRVELTVCGRVVDDLRIFRSFGDRVRVRPDVSAEELSAAYQSAHLFVFPSIAEGFAHVLLESLASGLPILSTTRTAAPDLIEHGRQGFIVDPGQPEEIARHIEWALTHRTELDRMRDEARALARQFTWQRFRTGIAEALNDAMDNDLQAAAAERRTALAV